MRVPAYANRHTAMFPLDFARELLPVQAGMQNVVSADQVQFTTDMSMADVEASLTAARGATRNDTPAALESAVFAMPDGGFTKTSRGIRAIAHVRQVDEAD